MNIESNLPLGAYRIDVPADVPVDAFWSVSIYNADGRFEENTLGVYSVNSVTGTTNDDGSMTIHLGDCEDGRVNCIPIMEGWNYSVRLYEPDEAILDGSPILHTGLRRLRSDDTINASNPAQRHRSVAQTIWRPIVGLVLHQRCATI